MATPTTATQPAATSLSAAQLNAAYRNMYLSRRMDDKEIQLKRQNRIFFQISGAGHEAILTAAGMLIRSGSDWSLPYYRDRAFCLQLGVTPAEMLYEAVGAAADPASGGRQMPSHWGHRAYNIVSSSSPTGTQFLQAVGIAEASLRAKLLGITEGFTEDEVVYVSTGEGATSEGEFWESINSACNLALPVVYVVEDNGYAISVPVEINTAGGNISKLLGSFPGLYIQEVDGCDFVASHAAMTRAVDYARKRKGPALVHAHVIRPYSHSLSDDEVMYRPASEREADAARDPIATFPKWLIAEGHATEESLAAMREEVDALVLAATDDALEQPQPTPDTIYHAVYSPHVDPCGENFDTEDDPHFTGEPTTMVDLLNACMKDEMRRDEKILVFGEDVADVSREQYLSSLKGKGGVFKVTWGLQKEFGGSRVYNSPLAEANIIGRAIGLALRGFKPVVEIQFFDYIWPAYMQLRNELALMRWRSNNAFAAPVVVRVTYGSYLK
ncbi:MAG TPA: thiamine pyrophosphate-dependent enzyme, partial [Gemmatimonadaceae bacterium]|nr:thiamine pyrophosphate-dependent enzyme [Gemmatimonadaceae bacterium]